MNSPGRESSLLGVVLCGGQSTRMGRDKSQLIHGDGVTYLQHSCDRMSALLDRLVVVGGVHQVDGVQTLPDLVANRGPAVGLLTAMKFAAAEGYQGCLINAVDLPDLEVAHLRELIEAWRAEPTLPCCAVASNDSSQGHCEVTVGGSQEVTERPEPLIAIYPTSVLASIAELVDSNHRSLSRWIAATSHKKVVIPAEAVRNVNQPSDLESNA